MRGDPLNPIDNFFRDDGTPKTENECRELRRILTRLLKRHTRFPDADWSLPAAEISRLRELVSSLESDDPFEQARVLFDEVTPFGSGDYIAAEKEISKQRTECVAALARLGGAAKLLALADVIRLPGLAASAVANGIENEDLINELLASGSANEPVSDFLTALSASLRRKHGLPFLTRIMELGSEGRWSDLRTASMLLDWPEEPATWEAVDAISSEAADFFWARRRPWRFEGPPEQIETLVSKFLGAGRAGAALSAVHPREAEIPLSQVRELLAQRVAEINQNQGHDDLDDFHISELFKSMRAREGLDELELAKWEYAYYPALEHHDEPLALFDRMARDPEFFVSILNDVYINDGESQEESEASEEQRSRSSISHRILMANNVVPGERDGVIDQEVLDSWVEGTLEEGRKAKLTQIVPSYVGRVLAHAKEKADTWPPSEVANVIERLKSAQVEQSIMIERFNMRGVYMKSMFEGGKQERELAASYRKWAAIHQAHPRTRAMLTEIAKRWDKDAKRADDEAERDKMRWE